MNGIVGAHHTSFTVAHLEPSVAFFRDLLGLQVVGTREVRDDYFGQVVGLRGTIVKAALIRLPGGHHIELFEYVQPRGQSVAPRPCDPGSCHLALLTSDLPALYQQLASSGIDFLSAPVLITAGPNRGGQAVYLRDPNGILLELFQPPSPQ
jgi:catechol 2,3-dioxygenase-like lactoylglutathione lyase family enzyme